MESPQSSCSKERAGYTPATDGHGNLPSGAEAAADSQNALAAASTDARGSARSVDVYAAREVHRNMRPQAQMKALIVEDAREVEPELRQRGYQCDRITHVDLLSSAGTEYFAKLAKGDYAVLWITTPNDWHLKSSVTKISRHWQKV
jgi:hypothetical protein